MNRQIRFSILLFLILLNNFVFSQKPQHFYNVDSEIKIEGTIQKIIMEPRYKNTSPFMVVILERKNTNQNYQVEISPIWFYEYDLHKGENLVVIGSLYTTSENSLNIIAREVRFRGEILVLRDKHGFPNWRGGKMQKRGWRKGKRF